jgi:Flp pilus assembly protein TadG
MRRLHRIFRLFVRGQRAAAIVEFALVVPIFFMVVWAVISFSRAYQRLNTLSTSLREGARYASTLATSPPLTGAFTTVQINAIKAKAYDFSNAYGFPIDTSRVTVTLGALNADVTVAVSAYPLFAGLNFIGNLQSINVSRSAIFRMER